MITVPRAVPSARFALKRATEAVHQRLHHHPVTLPLAAATLTAEQYRIALAALYGFHAPVERHLAAREPAAIDRMALLRADLAVLGVAADTLPVADDLPDLSDGPAWLAGRYVLDGSVHGGRAMLPNVRRALGYDEVRGASFLVAGGAAAKEPWVSLLARIEAELAGTAARAAACAAALSLFESLERWLDRCRSCGGMSA